MIIQFTGNKDTFGCHVFHVLFFTKRPFLNINTQRKHDKPPLCSSQVGYIIPMPLVHSPVNSFNLSHGLRFSSSA